MPSPRLRFAIACLTAGLVAGLPAAAAAAPVAISAAPGLQPAFDSSISDYVTRCTGAPVALSVAAPAGSTVAVDGDGPRAGSFVRSIALTKGQAFSFTVSGDATRTYHVRCLPANFPAYSAQRIGSPQARFYAVTPNQALGPVAPGVSKQYAALFDNGGAPVWWFDSPYAPIDAKLLPNGHVAWSRVGAQGGAEERTFDGTLVRTLNTIGYPSDIHEIQLLPNGNYLLPIYLPVPHYDLSSIGMPADVTLVDAVVQEITPDGTLAWEWRASDHIAPSEVPLSWRGPIAAGGASSGSYDLFHINSMERSGDDVVMSFRVLDAVYEANRTTGAVTWKLGGVPVGGESLEVVGDPVLAPPSPDPNGPLAGQHDARILPDGDITIHDNGTHQTAGQWNGRAPRAVRYRLDEAAGTATFVEQARDPDVPRSSCCGSSRKLPGGDWVMSWGGNSKVEEMTPAGGRAFNLDFGAPVFSYRANPILPTQLSARTLRDGMDEQWPRTALRIGGASPRFGDSTVAAIGETRTFTIANSGIGDVHVASVTVNGADAPAFTVTGETCSGQTLATDTTCEATVRFDPAALGVRTARLVVDSDAASGPNEAELTGVAVEVVAPPVGPAPPAPGSPAPGGQPTAPAQAPSNEFAFRLARLGSAGAVALTITVPGPGVLTVLETTRTGSPARTVTVGRAVVRPDAAGTTRLRVRLNRAGRRLLREGEGRLRGRVTVSFTPTGGVARTRSKTITLRGR